MERRRFVTALGTAGVALLAGCTSSNDDGSGTGTPDGTDDENGADGDETDNSENGDDGEGGEQGSSELGDPTEPLEEFVAAARDGDVDAATATFHPDHPFHPDNVDEESGWELDLSTEDARIEAVETRVVTESVTTEEISDRILGAQLLVGPDDTSRVIEERPTALVGATMTTGEGDETELLGVVAAHEGEWRLLWQGAPADTEKPAPALDARVVDDVTFDTDEDRARVQFADSPVADTVAVESANTEAATQTETVEAVEYLDVGLDPAGDEVLVRATVDGKSRLVHRERYPPNERIVEDILYNTDVDEDDPFGPRARIELNDVDVDGKLMAESTKAGGEITVDRVAGIRFVKLVFDGDGDEIVVRATVDGETTEIHRERYHP